MVPRRRSTDSVIRASSHRRSAFPSRHQHGGGIEQLDHLAEGGCEVGGAGAVVQGPGAIAEQPAGQSDTPGWNGERRRQGIEHRQDVAVGSDDPVSAQRHTWTARRRPPGRLGGQIPPVLGQGSAQRQRDEELGSGCRQTIGLGGKARRDLAIEAGGPETRKPSDPNTPGSGDESVGVSPVSDQERPRSRAPPVHEASVLHPGLPTLPAEGLTLTLRLVVDNDVNPRTTAHGNSLSRVWRHEKWHD
jgi:hypothetical protein